MNKLTSFLLLTTLGFAIIFTSCKKCDVSSKDSSHIHESALHSQNQAVFYNTVTSILVDAGAEEIKPLQLIAGNTYRFRTDVHSAKFSLKNKEGVTVLSHDPLNESTGSHSNEWVYTCLLTNEYTLEVNGDALSVQAKIDVEIQKI